MAILSVVIPTYNRNELLNYSLGRLLDANIDKFDVTVSVFDNKSAVPVESSIPAEIRREFGNRLKIVSNKANIGSSGKLVRKTGCMSTMRINTAPESTAPSF